MERAHHHDTRSSVNMRQSQQDRPNALFPTLPPELIRKIYEIVERARPCVGQTFFLEWSLIRCLEGGVRVFSFQFRELGHPGIQLLQRLQEIVEEYVEEYPLPAFPMHPAGDTIFSAKIQEGELQIEDFKTLATHCTKEFIERMKFGLEGSTFVRGTWQDADPGDPGANGANGPDRDPEMIFVICTKPVFNLTSLNHYFNNII